MIAAGSSKAIRFLLPPLRKYFLRRGQLVTGAIPVVGMTRDMRDKVGKRARRRI